MIGHLGPRVSALLDGQLPVAEEERAWDHVAHCAHCEAEVSRQGWVKTRLVGLTLGAEPDHDDVTRMLLAAGPPPTGQQLVALAAAPRTRTRGPLAALGTGAAGAVAVGMLTVVAPPADAPVTPRQASVVPAVVRPAELPRTTTPGAVPVRAGIRP